ncbi:MAG TPA: SAM-dependent methyltransferase [Stellaceae bacterium]|nr:SAM-dependent methyltransferase [Stellaceae bacterium]
MTPLADRLARRIRETGPISVAAFMAEANAHYYASRDPFGAAGDFITAPEVSQVFGELIGAWCADFWQRCGAPDPMLLVELGPGRGTLLADALRATRQVPRFAAALRLHLIERSPVLREKQAAALGAYRPQWHDDFAGLPPGPMLLIANEFLDALPISQFEQHDLRWHERMIGVDASGEKLEFRLAPEPLVEIPSGVMPQNEGKIREISPTAEKLGEQIGVRLRRQGGAALVIDYGYDDRPGAMALGDTLQALRRHRPVSPLEAPGECDLTAHVDFAAFARAARFGGATVYGPITQRVFLLALGLETRQKALLRHVMPAEAQTIETGCRRLIEPAQMGTLFKVLALAGPQGPVPAGFSAEAP